MSVSFANLIHNYQIFYPYISVLIFGWMIVKWTKEFPEISIFDRKGNNTSIGCPHFIYALFLQISYHTSNTQVLYIWLCFFIRFRPMIFVQKDTSSDTLHPSPILTWTLTPLSPIKPPLHHASLPSQSLTHALLYVGLICIPVSPFFSHFLPPIPSTVSYFSKYRNSKSQTPNTLEFSRI